MGDDRESKVADIDTMEAMINRLMVLQEELNAKNEEQHFLKQVIAEKQALCKQMKDQHAGKIKSLTLQARKQRNRAAGRGRGAGGYVSVGAGGGGSSGGAQQLPSEAEGSAQAAEAAAAATAAPAVRLDPMLLDKALGLGAWQQMQDRSLHQLHGALQARLDLVRFMKGQISGLALVANDARSRADAARRVSLLEPDIQELLSGLSAGSPSRRGAR